MINSNFPSSEFRQLEKELETLTQSLCEEVALNNAVSQAAKAITSSVTSPSNSGLISVSPVLVTPAVSVSTAVPPSDALSPGEMQETNIVEPVNKPAVETATPNPEPMQQGKFLVGDCCLFIEQKHITYYSITKISTYSLTLSLNLGDEVLD